MVTSFRNFIRAERLSDWNLHLWCIPNIIPYLYAAEHFQYEKGAQLYLQDMSALADKMDPEEIALFKEGYFSIRRTEKAFSGTWSDMIIKKSLMRPIKISGGITQGGVLRIVCARSGSLEGSLQSGQLCSKLEEYCCIQEVPQSNMSIGETYEYNMTIKM